MSMRRFIQLIVVVLLFSIATSAPTSASQLNQDKGPGGLGVQAAPTATIENTYIKTRSASNGQFVTGTTGGDPNTSNDNNKRLIFGYPDSVWSSFTTLRITNGGVTNDYLLGIDIDATTPATNTGSTILTVWEQDGVRVEQRLYIAQNSDTGRFDTTAFEYTIKNNNSSARNVGLRIMFDVMVGSNDGAPYFVLGTGQVAQQAEWNGAYVPEYWISYESPSFAADSLKGRGQLSGGNATRPDRFVVADWPQAYSTVWNYTVNPADPVTNDSATILYYNPVTINPGQTKTYRTYYGIAKSGAAAQLDLTGIEVTQAIQNLENNVVLIQDRPTFVRAHVRSTSGTVNDVTAQLIGIRNGSVLPGSPLQSSNQGGNVDILEGPNRSQLNDSFYFELPASWRSGTVDLEVRGVNKAITCREHAGTDNDCKAQVTFTQSPAADVRLVGIIWREDNTRHQPTWADINRVVRQIETTFPIPRLNWDRPYDIEPVFFAGAPGSVFQFARLNEMLKINRLLDGCISSWPVNCQRYYLGVLIDPPEDRELNGMADGIPADVATAYVLDGFTHPHEFGHAAGRSHVTCSGNEAGADDDYPYSNGRISQDTSGDNAFFGFDIFTSAIQGTDTGDLMSYCRPRWPSDYTYTNIRSHLVSRYGTSSAQYSPPLALMAGENAVIVSGIISLTDGSGEIGSIYTLSTPVSVTAPPPGEYAIRFENDQGQEIATHSFEPDQPSEGTTGLFALLLPWDASTTRIVLLHNGQTLDTRQRSASAPTVTVVSPNGGENLSGSTVTASWTASDPDNDPLSYVVQYSADAGAAWQTLASNWPSTTYEVNLDLLKGTSQGLLRVMASDGVNTAQDQSNATFRVAKHPPQVSIQSPTSDSLYVESQMLVLEGSAFDNEDGQLGDAALKWSSNLSGVLGNGHSLSVNASALAEGIHTITLTAQDSDGQTNSASLIVQVYRTRPVLPASLSVVPGEMSFTAGVNGGQTAWQTLSVRNGGDGTISWSASADQSWIHVSSLGSIAPTDILISVSPAGMSVGEYTGNIIITAAGVTNSPQVIPITLNVIRAGQVYLPVIRR